MMDNTIEISEKERERRRKISEHRKKVIEKKRLDGLRKYHARRRREKKKREREIAKLKEKERLKKLKEKEWLKKHKPKKIGRPKKKGRPKSKKKKTVQKVYALYQRNEKPPYKYKIISCRNGKQNKFIGKYRTIEEAYSMLNDLKMNDRTIIFPSTVAIESKIRNSVDEYILIEKGEQESILRNEYGKLVKQVSNIDGWTIIDKYRYQKEETFWVWGHNPKNDRKTFLWIYRNIVIDGLTSFLDFKRILTFKNKVVIKEDDGTINIVICKNSSDAVRFYNMLQQWAKRDKIKNLVFVGDYSMRGERRTKIENEIISATGWSKRKVQMPTTTFYTK